MTASEVRSPATTAVNVEVRGNSSKLIKAAGLFAAGLAATAAMMGPGAHKIADVISAMPKHGDHANQTQVAGQPKPETTNVLAAKPLADLPQQPAAPPAMNETDRARVHVLSRPVPSDTKAAAEMARAMPLPKDLAVEMPTAEQTKVLEYGQFAPIAARVFNNATKQKETHWTLHPWDVARLADQAAAELYKERHIRVEPRLIAGAYYTESSGVVQVGFDRKGVDLINKGKSVDEVLKSGSKASYGLFQIDQQHAGATDLDPVRGAKRAAEFLAEGQENLKRYPQLGMLAVSATYNASSTLRAKIFAGAEMDGRELESFEAVRNHAASMSYGAALYDVAHRTYQQHLAQAQKMGIPIAVTADSIKRPDPLRDERVDAVSALTGRFLADATEAPLDSAATPPTPTASLASQRDAITHAQENTAAARVTTAAAPTAQPRPKAQPKVHSSDAIASTRATPSRPIDLQFTDSRGNRVATPTYMRGQRNSAPVTASTADIELDRAILGGNNFQRGSAQGQIAATERTRSGMEASVSQWKSGASAMLGRVAAFHEQRTRDMATQREAP